MKKSKKIISLAVAITLIASLVGPMSGFKGATAVEAAEESSKSLDLTQYLNIYDDFDSYATGNTYTLNGDTSYGPTATASIETKDGSDRWLKLSGNNGVGHLYADNGWDRKDFSGAIDAYNGVAVYVRTESAATFNLQMRAGTWGITRTATNGDLDYTLVSSKNGEKTIAKGGGGVPLAAGFEGWIIIGYEELTPADGWSSAFTGITNVGYNDLKWINVMSAEITGASGAVYVDNMSFVEDCNTFIPALEEALAPPPSVYDYLNLYEDFEGFNLGMSTYLTNGDFGNASASEIMESDATGNKWLKIDGENHGWHEYALDGWARDDFSGKISEHDGVALYVHTDASATLNLIFKAGYQGVSRTATNSDLDYTLVSKNGVKIVTKGSYGVPLEAGFEGWVIIGYDDLTAASGWTDALTAIQNIEGWSDNLGFLNKMAVEITNTTAPVYVDNISFVKNTADMINFLAPEVPSADDYLVVYEDFEGFASGDSYTMDYTDADGGASVADATIARKSVENLWLKLSGNNRAGHIYSKPRTELSLSPSDCQGVAIYVKATKAATFNVLLRGGGLTRTNNNAELDYTLIASDGSITSAKHAYGIPLSAGYEGWVLIEIAELTNAQGWPNGALNDITDMNQIDVFTFEVTDTTGPVYVDNLSFVTDMEALVQMLHVAYPSEFVTCYEDFNGYAEGIGTYALDDMGNDFFENKTNATATIETRGEVDKWLKLSGNNNVGHIYGTNSEGNPNYGWPRTDFSADSTKYTGVSLYVKTEFAATLNLRLRIGYSYISRTATNGSLTYTLVPKDGEATTLTGANGITIPAGFEGTVILKNDALTAANGYTSVHAHLETAENKNLNQLNEFAAEISGTEGIVYLDNYAFVTDVDAYIASFANVSKTYSTGDLNKDHTVGDYDVMMERKFLTTDDAKMLQMDGNNGAGLALPSGENAKNPSGLSYDGFAVKVKTDSDVKLNLVLRYAYDGASGQYRTGFVNNAYDEKEVTYTLVSKYGSKLERKTNGGMMIPANFDGWLVFGKEEMSINGGWSNSPDFAETDVTGFTNLFPWITGVTDAVDFRIGSFAFAKDKTGLVNALVAGTSYGSCLGVIEDFENKNYGTFTFDSDNIDAPTANAAIVASSDNIWKEYDVKKDNEVDSCDLIRMKKLASNAIEETPIAFDASELLANAAAWNTPGLTADKTFQFDLESSSTWISVTGSSDNQEKYLAALRHHNVGETDSLLPAVKAGEWGYALTHLNGEKDGAGHLIDNLGYTGDAKPTTDAEALAKMEAFIRNQWGITESTDWYSMNSYYPWYHYAAEFGARAILTEIGEAQNNYQMHTAFARGAGRQYGKAWGIDFSMWHDGYMYNPNDYSGWYKSGTLTNTKTDANCGHSMSLLERSLLMGYMSGANSVVAEAGGAMSLSKEDKDGDGYYDLTSYGETVGKVYQFTKRTDIGTTYTPVGIVLDYNHGSYAGIQKLLATEEEKSFYTFDYTAGDRMTKNLAEMIWGEDAWMSGAMREEKNEADAMVNNEEYGDSFDILLQNADIDVLKSYPVLLLSGEITLSSDELKCYKKYVNKGGTLLLNRAYTSQFEVTSSRSYGAGKYIVYGSSDYDLTGLDEILKEQIAKYQPVKIAGNVQYITSVKDNAIYVALINNEGVTKKGNKVATVDPSKDSGVTVTYTGKCSVASATDIYNNREVALSGKAATVTVPAGGIVVLEISLK